MDKVKSIKIILFFAAMIFVAKPFIGFGLFGHFKSPVQTNIFVKVFSKRKIEDGRLAMNAIAKAMAAPFKNLFLRFTFLLAILFPLVFAYATGLTSRSLQALSLALQPQQLTLLTGQLLI